MSRHLSYILIIAEYYRNLVNSISEKVFLWSNELNQTSELIQWCSESTFLIVVNIEKVEKEVIFLSFKRNIVEILYRVANRRKGEARTPTNIWHGEFCSNN